MNDLFFFVLLKRALTSKRFFFFMLIFNLLTSTYFFFAQKFFVFFENFQVYTLFEIIPYICIIIIPLLTFKKNDTFLMQHTPITVCAQSVVNFLVCLIQFIFITLPVYIILLCVHFFVALDFFQIVSCSIILLLYVSAIISISLFFYELFSPVVALAVNILVILLSNVSSFSTRFLGVSFFYRFESAAKGIIDTRDILFFVIVTIFFIFATTILIQKKCGKIFLQNEKKSHIFFALILFFVLLNSSRYYKRFDITYEKKYSLSTYSKTVLSSLHSPLKITYYRSRNLLNSYPETKNIYEFLKSYQKENKNIFVNLKNPEKENNKIILHEYNIAPQQLQNTSVNKTEVLSVYSAIILEYEGKEKIIPFILYDKNIEYEITRRIKELVENKTARVHLCVGKNFSLNEDFSYITSWLTLHGFSVYETSLMDFLEVRSFQNNPNDVLLLLGSSTVSENEYNFLKNYIKNGGKVFFAFSPYAVDVKNAWEVSEQFSLEAKNFFSELGLSFYEALVLSDESLEVPLQDDENNIKKIDYPFWLNLPKQENAKEGMSVFWATPMIIDSEHIEPLLYTSKSSFLIEKNGSSLFNLNPLQKIAKQNDTGSFTVAALIDKNFAIISDELFLHTFPLMYAVSGNEYKNLNFLVSTIFKLLGEDEMAFLLNKNSAQENKIKITTQESFIKFSRITLVLNFFIVPLFILILFLVFKLIRYSFIKKWSRCFR